MLNNKITQRRQEIRLCGLAPTAGGLREKMSNIEDNRALDMTKSFLLITVFGVTLVP